MPERLSNDRRIDILEMGLDGAALRQKVIANNIANVDTPGYKASDVAFEEQLRAAIGGYGVVDRLRTSHPRHLQNASAGSAFQPVVYTSNEYTLRNDGNNVDIDREMARLAKNSIYYNSLVQAVSNEFRLLRMAITEGRG